MATPALNPRMTAEDASFLYLERKEMPLHIGSVSTFEGPLPFDSFVQAIDSKLHLIPRYRQRVTPAPFSIGHPSWEDDHNFDIRNHIMRVTVDAPGDDEALRRLAGRVFTTVMDRQKPLWEIYVVDGLADGRGAMVFKVHHCMVDGVSGVGLMSIIMETSREIPQMVEKPGFAPKPVPDPAELYFKALAHNFQQGLERLMSIQTDYFNMLQNFGAPQTPQVMTELAPLMAELAMPADRLPFNKPCSGERRITFAEFSFAEARAIRGAIGGTVNDVALTILTGAVSRFVKMSGEAVSRRFCRYMVPVNVRRDNQQADLGNQVSALLVNVPLDIEDAGERLKFINHRTDILKKARLADMLRLGSSIAGAAPAPLQAMIEAIPFMPFANPPFNMVSTNVPGPMIPLYGLGQEMLQYLPHVPVGNNLGMGCAIQSYNQKLAFGITSDYAAAPQAHHMREFLLESYSDLKRAAGMSDAVEPVTPARRKKKTKSSAAADESTELQHSTSAAT